MFTFTSKIIFACKNETAQPSVPQDVNKFIAVA